MKKTALLLCAFVMFALCQTFAQNLQVSGRVTSSGNNNQPLSGVNVTVKGTSNGVITNATGDYTISVPPGAVLTVSYVGMSAVERTITASGTQDFTLTSSVGTMDELIVVGYGTQKKSVVTGAISKVTASDIDNQPIMRIEQFLQGRASGLTIAAASGQPGSGSTLRIRGTTSLNNSDPLYVVDGIPVDNGGIDYLNTNDIESVEVLKDAASAAIYGTRAASGVILVTTKRGKAGKTVFSYNGYYGVQRTSRKLDLLNATEYATLRNEASVADGGNILFPDPASLGKGTDWQDVIFNNSARIQDHQISVSGGNERATFFTSFGIFNQEGIVATEISDYKRFNFRTNADFKLARWASVGINVGYSHIKSVGLGNTNSEFGGPLSSAINLDPITKIVETDPAIIQSNYNFGQSNGFNRLITDANGFPYGISSLVGQEFSNPLAYIQTRVGGYGWSDNFVANTFLDIEPIKGLHLKTNLGAKYAFYGSEGFSPINQLNSTTVTNNNSFSTNSSRSLNYTWENTVSYTRSILQHTFTVLAGTGAYVDNYSSRNAGVTYRNLPVNTYGEAKSMNFNVLPADVIAYGSTNTPHKLSSVFGRIIYNYGEKYLFSGLIRRDGSTRFGSNKKYGYFPSASVGWVASKEDFWPVNKVVNFFKLRGSYGITGNDNAGDFAYISTIGGGRNYTFGLSDIYTLGFSPNNLSNPDLQWEETKQTDIGFDATLFQKLTVSFDWYKKKTEGILGNIAVPLYVGVGGPVGNVSNMENSGVELELGYTKMIRDVKLEFKGNVSHLKNRVTFLGQDKTFIDGASIQSSQYTISRTAVGHAIGSFYGFQTLGIFQTQSEVDSYVDKNGGVIQPAAQAGDFRFADLNGDGKIGPEDRTFIGDPTPDWSFGFTVSAAWRGLDFTVFGQGVAGNQIYNGLRRLDVPNANYTTKALDRWTGPGTTNDFPRLSNTDPNHNFSNPSAFYLEDGDYFRIKVLQLGYTLPNFLSNKASLQKVRIYISGNNLVTFTKYTGFDPEIGGGSYGIDRGYYPQARSFTAGLNLTF